MDPNDQRELEEIATSYQARNFDIAADAAVAVLHRAASASPEGLNSIATWLCNDARLQPIFASVSEARGADVFASRLSEVLAEVLGPSHPIILESLARLATIHAIQGRTAESARIWEQALTALSSTHAPDDPQVSLARGNLAAQYRNLDQPERASALYAALDVCEHLQSAKQYILDHGGRIYSVTCPWSRNCRNWMLFEGVVIDGESLRKRLALPAVIITHSHLGTHDGHEQGLVCSEHHDALIGTHQARASATDAWVG